MMIIDIEMMTTYGRHCSGTNGCRGDILRQKENPLLVRDQRTWYSLCLQCCKHLCCYFSSGEDWFQNVFQTNPPSPSLGQVLLPEIVFLSQYQS